MTTESRVSTRPQSKGEETRALILRQALDMAGKVGLSGLSIGSVAKAAGLSKSGLFAHFQSKEDLQLQVLETGVDMFVRKVVAQALKEPRGVPRVRAIFENWVDWFERNDARGGGCVFISSSTEFDDRPGPLRDYLVGIQRDALSALATAARIAVEEGHFASDVDVEQFAHDVYSILLAYHHFSRLLDDPKAGERARRAFEALLAQSLSDARRSPDGHSPDPSSSSFSASRS